MFFCTYTLYPILIVTTVHSNMHLIFHITTGVLYLLELKDHMATLPKFEDESDMISSLEATIKTDLCVYDAKSKASCITASTSSDKKSSKKATSDDGNHITLSSASSTNEDDTTSSLKVLVDGESFNIKDQHHCDSMFDDAVKSVTEKIQVYFANSGSVKLKKHLASSVLQDLRTLVSCLDNLEEHSAKEMCSILMEKTIVMKQLYAFLSLMFEG